MLLPVSVYVLALHVPLLRPRSQQHQPKTRVVRAGALECTLVARARMPPSPAHSDACLSNISAGHPWRRICRSHGGAYALRSPQC